MAVSSSKEVNRISHMPIPQSVFSLPSEILVSAIASQFPCRHEIIRTLITLLSVQANKNIVLYGLNATGKSVITKRVLERLSISQGSTETNLFQYDIIKTAECITTRHLMEKTVNTVADTLGYRASNRCESTSQLVNELEKMLHWSRSQNPEAAASRHVLVFDGIDQQSVHTPMLPALAKLGELVCICTSH